MLGILIIMLSVVIASATVQTLEDASEFVQIDELQPMAANVCEKEIVSLSYRAGMKK